VGGKRPLEGPTLRWVDNIKTDWFGKEMYWIEGNEDLIFASFQCLTIAIFTEIYIEPKL
jgi:hypothetical protein